MSVKTIRDGETGYQHPLAYQADVVGEGGSKRKRA
jgi:hypothetical protein